MSGEPGQADSQFDTPHGIWLDGRPGRELAVVVADRANRRLQWFTPGGLHLKTLDGFIPPTDIDRHQDVLLVPDLGARMTLLEGNDRVIVQLGEESGVARAGA